MGDDTHCARGQCEPKQRGTCQHDSARAEPVTRRAPAEGAETHDQRKFAIWLKALGRCKQGPIGARVEAGTRIVSRPPAAGGGCPHPAATGLFRSRPSAAQLYRAGIVQAQGRPNECEVRKRLWEIPGLSPQVGIILFGEQPNIVAKRHQALE